MYIRANHVPTLIVGRVVAGVCWSATVVGVLGAPQETLPGTERLESQAYFPALIGKQWDTLLLEEIASSRENRESRWQRDYSNPDRYAASMELNRERLRRSVGAVDKRLPAQNLKLVAELGRPALRAETATYEILAVKWPVFEGVNAEGLLLKPKLPPKACAVVIPDADQTPEMLTGINPGIPSESQFARHLAENGIMVLIPTLIDRRSLWSGDRRLDVYTDEPHREWIYRQSFVAGRHPIGYELQKVQAALDWFSSEGGPLKGGLIRAGVAGYREGGLLAFYAAALDRRVSAAWVSGYFQSREEIWREPLYRNIWGLLTEFGDAEIAAMIAPRGLVVEYSEFPQVVHPSPPDRTGDKVLKVAAPGKITTPSLSTIASEWKKAVRLAGVHGGLFAMIERGQHPVRFGSPAALRAFVRLLGVADASVRDDPFVARHPLSAKEIDARQFEQIRELEEFTQEAVRRAEYERESFFWAKLTPDKPERWEQAIQPFRDNFWNEVLGRFPDTTQELGPRTRLLKEHSDASITTYEVVLNVRPGVLTWGYLLLPGDLKAGEFRPVVVCQHGAMGQPADTLAPGGAYQAYARTLAQRGFIVYAPFNPTKLLGEDFRQLQRKGYLVKKTIFGIYAASHQRVLQWLKQLPFVDGRRMAFYGISYGGKTAVHVPAVLVDYCLSICSGDWNDFARKTTSLRWDKVSLMFYDSYENGQFNLANTFNYPEMAALIAPRPFMVESGYKDRVAALEWAAGEYSFVQRLYFSLGIPERTEMAFFDGPHMIHGERTFAFLHRNLQWPEPTK